MEHGVIAARDFSEQPADKEEDADAQAADMLRWIRNALGFKREKYGEGGFRLCFERGQNRRQTLVDVKTFVDNCLMGLDFRRISAIDSDDEPVAHGGEQPQAGVSHYAMVSPSWETVCAHAGRSAGRHDGAAAGVDLLL